MGKYELITRNILAIFELPAWKSESVDTYPSNFIITVPKKEYLRVTVVPNGSSINRISASGLLLIDIFTAVGSGPLRPSLIADVLDKYLAGKTFNVANATTQLKGSYLAGCGVDKADPTLYRSQYTIPFNHFGVF